VNEQQIISRIYGKKFGGSFSWSTHPPAFSADSIGSVKRKHVAGKRGIISSSLIPIDLKTRIIA
jgi:hypothetical protein